MIKKFISSFIISALLTQSAYALSIGIYNPTCRLGTMHIPISDKTSIELMQMLQNEFDKDTSECSGRSSMVYDKRTHTLIVTTVRNNANSIEEFIQNTDKALNMDNHLESTDNGIPTNPNDKTDDENIDSP